MRRNTLGYNSTSTDHRSFSDYYTRQNRNISTNPNLLNIIPQKLKYFYKIVSEIVNLNPPPWGQNQKVCQNQKVQGKIELYQRQRLHRNVNRLIDTKEMNRISGKPLKTRDSGTLAVAGILCLLFSWSENLWQVGRGGVHF